jgi:hypothetical protein
MHSQLPNCLTITISSSETFLKTKSDKTLDIEKLSLPRQRVASHGSIQKFTNLSHKSAGGGRFTAKTTNK